VYAKLGATLVLHSVLVDGLQKMRHFKNAGEATLSVRAVICSPCCQPGLSWRLVCCLQLIQSIGAVRRKRSPSSQQFCLFLSLSWLTTLATLAGIRTDSFPCCSSITGRASGRVPFVTDRLQPDVDFRLWDSAAAREDDNSAAADPCNTFKADKVLGRSSDMFDQSGIITLLCR
jgi:hypothetical protein